MVFKYIKQGPSPFDGDGTHRWMQTFITDVKASVYIQILFFEGGVFKTKNDVLVLANCIYL